MRLEKRVEKCLNALEGISSQVANIKKEDIYFALAKYRSQQPLNPSTKRISLSLAVAYAEFYLSGL